MKKYIFLVAMLYCAGTAAAQQQFVTRIEPLRNEKWWGYFTGGGPSQPFSEAFQAEPTGESFTVPFMVSDQGRYIWSEEPFSVSSDGRSFTVTSSVAPLKASKGGKTLREAYLYCVHKHILPDAETLPGHMVALPIYDIGLSSISAPGSETLLSLADSLAAHGISSGTILIPDGWQDASVEGGFDRNLYDSFADAAARIHGLGFNLALTVTPYVPAAGRAYIDARQAGALLSGADRHPIIINTYAGYYTCLDIRREDVSDAIEGKLEKLTSQHGGITLYFDCRRALESLSDEPGREYMERWVEIGERFGAAIYPLGFAAPTLWRPFAVTLALEASWASLQEALECIINAGLAGRIYSYMSLASTTGLHDDEELLLRACQLAAFMPLSALAPSANLFRSQENAEALRLTMEQRREIDEYVVSLLRESESTGEPLVRHMEYQYPHQGFANCRDQFMLGSKYLVAPVLEHTLRRTVRLPRGTWIASDGTKHRGPRVINVDVSRGEMPLFRLR